MLILKVKIQ